MDDPTFDKPRPAALAYETPAPKEHLPPPRPKLPLVLNYRHEERATPQRATPGHLLRASLGVFLYLLLTAFFGFVVLVTAGRPIAEVSIFPFLATLFCGYRAWAALRVVADHLRAPRE